MGTAQPHANAHRARHHYAMTMMASAGACSVQARQHAGRMAAPPLADRAMRCARVTPRAVGAADAHLMAPQFRQGTGWCAL
eukprot:364170-Chlamydomonas_euryale.AAC.11